MRGQIRITGESRQEKGSDLAEVIRKLDLVLEVLFRPPWWKRAWRRIGEALRWR
jgi:hypothetical protein